LTNDKHLLYNEITEGRPDQISAAKSAAAMKRSATLFLQFVVVLIGLAALALLLWEPQIEGRSKDATFFQVYFQDPLLALVYVGSIPFYVALYQAIKVLGQVGRNQAFSPEVVKALRTIRYCAFAIIGFVVVAVLFIFLMTGGDDENPGVPIFLGILIIFPSIVVATTAAIGERVVQNAVDLKSENDLTV
jgi:hypothetical protein